MAELDLDALEQAAREAGGGCWFSAGWTVGSRGFEVGDLKSRDRICSDATERRAEFIAAANPATILELLGRLKAAEKERDDLLEALKKIMPFTATAAIGCHGEKCREPWCHSCNGEEEAEAAAQKGCDALAKARAAIARATGEQP